MQDVLPGFENYISQAAGSQEKATQELIEAFVEGKTLNAGGVYICKTMINISRNFDALSAKGRDTSRVMAQLLSWYQELEAKYPEKQQVDESLADLLSEAGAK